jgi:Zn-dependent protease
MKTSYQIGKIWDIPLKVHISLLLFLGYIALDAFVGMWTQYGVLQAFISTMAILILLGCFFGCIGLHELGHSFVAIRKGCKVREITLLIIGGAAVMENLPKRPKDEFIMAAAGPAVSATLALAFGLVSMQFPNQGQSSYWGSAWGAFFYYLTYWNTSLAIFNLLPAYPMDGGRITRALLTPRLGRLRATRIAMLAGRAVAILMALIAIRGISPYVAPWNIPLLLVAGFVFITGNREYRQIQIETLLEQRGFTRHFGSHSEASGSPPIDDTTAWISPPPYSDGPADHAKIEKLGKRRFPFF